MAQVIQLPKGHFGVPSEDVSNTLIKRLINQLKEAKRSIYHKSHQNIKKIKKSVKKNPQLIYIKQLADQATNSIQKVPKNLKKRVDSVLNHIGNMMASSSTLPQPTFYQSIVIAFIKQYTYEICGKPTDDIDMPSFDQFYEEFIAIFKADDKAERAEAEYALALLFYEEISKEIEDHNYNLMNDVILSSIAITIDSELLGGHTQNQLYLTYKGFVKIASAQASPSRPLTDQKQDEQKYQKKIAEMEESSNRDTWDDDEQACSKKEELLSDNEEEADKDLHNSGSQDLPSIPDIDNIEFTSGESLQIDAKMSPFNATLEEFTKRFESQVIWDELEEKIDPQTIARASFEFYQITKLNFSEIRNPRPQRPSLREQQKFIKSVYQEVIDHLQGALNSSSIKSLDYYEICVKWLERQIIGVEQEQPQMIEVLTEDGKIQPITGSRKKRRFENLNQRVTNLCLFSLGTLYQNADQRLHFEKWQKYLNPYFEAVQPVYKRIKDYSLTAYNRINQEVIIPMNEKLVVVLKNGSAVFSVYVKQKIVKAKITQQALQKLNSSRVLINEQWMRLDFDNDGVVSIEDCKNTAKSVYSYLKQKKMIELKQGVSTVYERALLRIKNMKDKVLVIKQKED